jgi:hypothetical protein
MNMAALNSKTKYVIAKRIGGNLSDTVDFWWPMSGHVYITREEAQKGLDALAAKYGRWRREGKIPKRYIERFHQTHRMVECPDGQFPQDGMLVKRSGE